MVPVRGLNIVIGVVAGVGLVLGRGQQHEVAGRLGIEHRRYLEGNSTQLGQAYLRADVESPLVPMLGRSSGHSLNDAVAPDSDQGLTEGEAVVRQHVVAVAVLARGKEVVGTPVHVEGEEVRPPVDLGVEVGHLDGVAAGVGYCAHAGTEQNLDTVYPRVVDMRTDHQPELAAVAEGLGGDAL